MDKYLFMFFLLLDLHSLSLCFEDINLQDNEELMFILKVVNMVFAVLFTIEMLLKWIAFGLFRYFTSMWTCLDFVIVCVSILSLAIEGSANLTALRSLRTLRALRPLRAISRWQGMKASTEVSFSEVLLLVEKESCFFFSFSGSTTVSFDAAFLLPTSPSPHPHPSCACLLSFSSLARIKCIKLGGEEGGEARGGVGRARPFRGRRGGIKRNRARDSSYFPYREKEKGDVKRGRREAQEGTEHTASEAQPRKSFCSGKLH